MGDCVIYHSNVRGVADKTRLKVWMDRQQHYQTPVYYVLPSKKWLASARGRQAGLAFLTFDDVADLILKAAGEKSFREPTTADVVHGFYQVISGMDEWKHRSVQQRLRVAKDLASTYHQLKRLGVTMADRLPPDLQSLEPALATFEWEADRSKFWDPDTRIIKAAQVLKENRLAPFSLVVDGYFDFTPVQYLMLNTLSAQGYDLHVYLPYIGETAIYNETVKNLLDIGFRMGDVGSTAELRLEYEFLIKATTVAEEVHAVVDDILAQLDTKVPEDFGIVLANETYRDVLVQIAGEKGLSLATSSKTPIRYSDFVSGILQAIAAAIDDERDSLVALKPILASFVSSPEEYEACVHMLSLLLKSDASIDVGQDDLVTTLVHGWKGLIGAISERDTLTAYLSILTEGLEKFHLQSWWIDTIRNGPTEVARQAVFEWKAFERLLNVAKSSLVLRQQLEALNEQEIELDAFVAWLETTIADEHIFIERAPGRGISIFAFRDVASFQGTNLHVLGMNEEVYPGRQHLEGYVQLRHLDELGIQYGAPTAATLRAKQDALFGQLQFVAKTITYSYVVGVDEEQEQIPSPCLDCLPKLVDVISASESNRMQRKLNGQFVHHGRTDELSKFAYHYGLGYQVNLPLVLQHFRESLERLQTRKEHVKSTINGLVSNGTVSVTALESYAACPFRYAMERVFKLSVEVSDELDRRDLGTLVHQVINSFYERLGIVKVPFATVKAQYLAGAEAVLRSTFDDCWTSRFGQSDLPKAYLERQKRKWWQTLREWWSAEQTMFWNRSELGDMCVDALEYSVQAPLTLPNGDTVIVRGRVDRIDADEKGFVVYDYKTGTVGNVLKELEQGKRLQLPFYFLGVENLLGVSPYGGAYISLKENPAKRANNSIWQRDVVGRFGCHQTNAHQVEELSGSFLIQEYKIEQMVSNLYEGMQFDYSVRPADTATCNYCSYKSVCRITKEAAHDAEQ